jgi:arylsulfatase
MKKLRKKDVFRLSVLGLSAISLVGSASPVFAADMENAGTVTKTAPANVVVSNPAVKAQKDSAVKKKTNIVYILLDDMGYSDFGSYGSEIKTPNIDKLAANGLKYNNYTVCPVCSPTRASLLTGRDNHAVGMGDLADLDMGVKNPNARGRISDKAATVAQILKSNGYSTMAVGKWHVAPLHQLTPAGPFNNWPLAKGFERYYGYLNGETDQYDPRLTYDNHFIETPKERGYQLSADLVDQAKQFLTDQVSVTPEKPFFLYLGFGAVHSPHQAPKEYIDMYNGVYDKGWDKIREERFTRQKKLGIIPQNAELTKRDEKVKLWESLSPKEKKLFARFEQAYAGYLSYADAQIGRFVEYLKSVDELDNTMIVLSSDNGATCYGGDEGTDYFPNLSGRQEDNKSRIDDYYQRINKIGGADFEALYQRGWAMVSDTPFQGYKGSTYAGGTRSPLIIQWPEGIKDKGELREQAVYVSDITPTVLDLVDVKVPEVFQGVKQLPMDGNSIVKTFNNANAKSDHNVFYNLYKSDGNRSITKDGWKAVFSAEDAWSLKNKEDRPTQWKLYNLNEDFSEAHDLAKQYPEKLANLKQLWQEEAQKHGAIITMKQSKTDAVNNKNMYKYLPGMEFIEQGASPKVSNRSYSITVPVTIDKKADGVLVACGNQFSGYAFYVKNNKLVFVQNYFGEITRIESNEEIPRGKSDLKYQFNKTGKCTGVGQLFIDDKQVGEGNIEKTFAGVIGGEGLSVGRDAHSQVDERYKAKGEFPFNNSYDYVMFELQNDQNKN